MFSIKSVANNPSPNVLAASSPALPLIKAAAQAEVKIFIPNLGLSYILSKEVIFVLRFDKQLGIQF